MNLKYSATFEKQNAMCQPVRYSAQMSAHMDKKLHTMLGLNVSMIGPTVVSQ
jgi:hypothetical protein